MKIFGFVFALLAVISLIGVFYNAWQLALAVESGLVSYGCFKTARKDEERENS